MKEHSTKWKSSISKRKQRKYAKAAPLHIKSKLMHSTLSQELRKKHGTRSLQVRSGDKVKIMRGNFKGKAGKVETADVKNNKVYITKMEISKKDGTKTKVVFRPSNLKIIELSTGDPRRLKNKKQTSAQKQPENSEKEKSGE